MHNHLIMQVVFNHLRIQLFNFKKYVLFIELFLKTILYYLSIPRMLNGKYKASR